MRLQLLLRVWNTLILFFSIRLFSIKLWWISFLVLKWISVRYFHWRYFTNWFIYLYSPIFKDIWNNLQLCWHIFTSAFLTIINFTSNWQTFESPYDDVQTHRRWEVNMRYDWVISVGSKVRSGWLADVTEVNTSCYIMVCIYRYLCYL